MLSIKDKWEDFVAHSGYTEADEEFETMRLAFYGGAGALLKILFSNAGGKCLNRKESAKVFGAVLDEYNEFIEELRRRS